MIKLQCDYKRGERTQMRRHIAGSAVGKSSDLSYPEARAFTVRQVAVAYLLTGIPSP
jgi:hypothetical protein